MKYKLTETQKKTIFGTLTQIVALVDFGEIKAGDLGGFISKEDNLSQDGYCWISGNAKIWGNAKISGNIDQFTKSESAFSWASKCIKLHIVMLGCNDKYWVVCFADAQKLSKMGYEVAPQIN